MPDFAFVEGEVLRADLHDEFVEVGGYVHETVQFVENGDGVEVLAGRLGEVHGWGEDVRGGVGNGEEATATWGS